MVEFEGILDELSSRTSTAANFFTTGNDGFARRNQFPKNDLINMCSVADPSICVPQTMQIIRMDESEHPGCVNQSASSDVSRMTNGMGSLRNGKWKWSIRRHTTNHTVIGVINFENFVEEQYFGIIGEIGQESFVERLRHICRHSKVL